MERAAHNPVVRTSALAKVYRKKPVLSDIDLEINAGERLCLVGNNGSGKSTLLEIIMGLKVPSSGQIEVFGRSPSDARLKGRRAMLMDRAAFPYYAKVKEIVWLYSGFHPRPVDIAALLRTYELDGDTFVRHLSKGQKQRMGIMLTLLGDPELLLLDEPTSGLDPRARLLLWQVVSDRLAEDPRRTLIFATHDLSEAEQWADRVAILHHGRLITVRSPEELCRSVIGTRRKLTIVGGQDHDIDRWQTEEVVLISRLGAEIALYTDHPERVLNAIGVADDSLQIRIENVTLKDAFLELTGEKPDEKFSFAMQKSW